MTPLLFAAAAITIEAGWGTCRPTTIPVPVLVEAAHESGEDVRGRLVFTDFGHDTLEVPLDLPRGAHKRLRIPVPFSGSGVQVAWEADVGPALDVEWLRKPPCQGTLVGVLRREGATAPGWGGGAPAFDLGPLAPEDLDSPWWTLESLDAIVAEGRALSDLSDARFAAIATWVRAGGLLVVVPGIDPAPLAASKRLPPSVDLARGGLLSNGLPAETRWGTGAVVVSPDEPSRSGAFGDAIRKRADAQKAFRAEREVERTFVRKQLQAGSGPGSKRSGVPLAALGTLAALIAAGHEFVRRRWVQKLSELRLYGAVTGGGLASLTLASFLLARFAIAGHPAAPTLVATTGSDLAHAFRAIEVMPGGESRLASGERAIVDGDVRILDGSTPRIVSEGGVGRSAAARSLVELGGVIRVPALPAGGAVVNGTNLDLGPGVILQGGLVFDVPAVRAGGSAQIPATPSPIAQSPALTAARSLVASDLVYAAPTPAGGWLLVHVDRDAVPVP